jgi:aldehyde:ferredoxin oxidoreductase
MGYGYQGKILRVDLTNQEIHMEERDDQYYRTLLGGRGIGYDHILREVPQGIDPFSEENRLILATGVMTGAPLAASCRFSAIGKSPLTGAAGESEAGGFFGPELKKAGFDAVVFQGRAEKPVYLQIVNETVEIKEAGPLAHLGAKEVEDAIRRALGNSKVRVAQTGLAGMNRVRFANITNNLGHFNGRTGMGALMGSKNVRAVAVLGTKKLRFHDPAFIHRTAKDYAKTFRQSLIGQTFYEYGTTSLCEILSHMGGLPVHHFRRSQLEDPSPLGGDTYNRILLRNRKGCYACPIRCKRGIALDDPEYGVDSRYGGPEYETMAALGTNLDILDLKAIAKGNEICNRYCMDTISAGMTIAFACECFEKGLITRADTDGLQMVFGDADLMIKLLEMIARREGLGDLLAEGTARLARQWGVENESFNLTVKGQELALHDPRGKVGVGFGYAISPYGADHMYAIHDPAFVDKESFTLQSAKPLGIQAMHPTRITPEKIRTYIRLDYFWKMMDAMGLCVFGFAPRGVMPIETMVKCVNAVTGWDADLEELMAAGERGSMIARTFNSREGFNIRHDRLPKRLFDPVPDGPNAGKVPFTREEFQEAIRGLYKEMGCDPKTGRPNRETLKRLDLQWLEAFIK